MLNAVQQENPEHENSPINVRNMSVRKILRDAGLIFLTHFSHLPGLCDLRLNTSCSFVSIRAIRVSQKIRWNKLE